MTTTDERGTSRGAGGPSRVAPLLFRLRDAFPRSPRGSRDALPPGQRAIESFPRYGTHFARRDPRVPESPRIDLAGPGIADELRSETLEELPRAEIVADFHCVAGWTARDLHWEGMLVRDVYERFVAGNGGGAGSFSHIRAVGRDGFRAVLALEDALADDVLIADRLHGAPLPLEHGGPFRLVSASQYGYKSVKCLERIEFHTDRPSDAHMRPVIAGLLKLVGMHPRARVWHEERHWLLPGWSQRFLNIRVIHPFAYVLGYLGARRRRRG
jgi:DMSO/TMAO reductase YedYZ molybdopterin-dependent catalytic subunit